MRDDRPTHTILLELENVGLDLKRLSSTVELLGLAATADGLGPEDGGAIKVVGEVLSHRAERLGELVAEMFKAERQGA